MPQCVWARLTIEESYKTPTADPLVNNVNTLVIELVEDDPINIEMQPNTEQLYGWLMCGAPDRGIGETFGIQGPIRTMVYPVQVPLLFGWAFSPIADQGVLGSEIPWLTAEPEGQLASMALDFAYRDDDGVERKDRYLGGKVISGTLTADRGTRDGAFILELQTAWSERVATTAVAPPSTDYPGAATPPYMLSSTSGNVLVNGQTITDYDLLSLAANYTAPIRFDEDPTITRIRHHRLEYVMSIRNALKFTPDWRALENNRTTFAASFAMEYPGGVGQQVITFDMGGNCRMPEWGKTMPLAGDRRQTVEIISQFDRALGRQMLMSVDVQT